MATMPHTNDKGEEKEYLVATNKASLLWMASLGCIEINPWFSRVTSPDNPDFCIIDLDPDKQHFDQVIAAALEVKKVLDAIGVTAYPKTSGSTGMHIYIPLGAKYTYDQSQMFAKIIVTLVHKQIPGIYQPGTDGEEPRGQNVPGLPAKPARRYHCRRLFTSPETWRNRFDAINLG
jgi:bifunctional non-homologous end joining protein LigD